MAAPVHSFASRLKSTKRTVDSPFKSPVKAQRKTLTMMSTVHFSFGLGCAVALLSSRVTLVSAFTNPVFQETTSLRRTSPSKKEGVEIEMPDFDELFNRISRVSPLARLALEGQAVDKGGLAAVNDRNSKDLKWKVIESGKKGTIHHIDKIDNFQKLQCPIIRFRSSVKGPCVPERFADFIMSYDERSKWDPQIAEVQELYPIYDLAAANLAMGMGRFGDCSHLGVGYCQTKANFVVPPREQLTLCGVQSFDCGSAVIWGTEMEEWHNHLLPEGERHTRAKSHLFATTLVPTGPDSFDVEYVLQMDVGGKIPAFLTTPVLVDTVKGLFRHAKNVYADEGGELAKYLKEKKAKENVLAEQSLLMTP